MWLNFRGPVGAKTESALVGRGGWAHADCARPCWKDLPQATSEINPSAYAEGPEVKSQRSSWTRHLGEASEDQRLVVKPDGPFLTSGEY